MINTSISSVINFRKKCLNMILYRIYIASGAGADNPMGVNFKQEMRLLYSLVICLKFQKNYLNSDFLQIHDFVYDLIHARQGQITHMA